MVFNGSNCYLKSQISGILTEPLNQRELCLQARNVNNQRKIITTDRKKEENRREEKRRETRRREQNIREEKE